MRRLVSWCRRVNVDQHIALEKQGELDLPALLRVAWAHKYLVASVALAAAIAAVVLALTTKPIYRAEVAITEVHEGSMGAGGALASQIGGLASMAGITLGAGSNVSRTAQAVLKSRHLVEEFVKRNNLMPELFPNSKKAPTLWLAVKRFQEGLLRISEDTRQGKTTLSIDWTDPETAARWANGLVALANELIRARALDEANRNVAYLREQINKTTVVELQRVMYDLIENETKTLMLANARVEYAFTVVDPAVPPELRISPQRTLMVAVGGTIGLCVGVALAYLLELIKRNRRKV
jgi:uncharacterized protein involved in exopolysaccharide biosynthesis